MAIPATIMTAAVILALATTGGAEQGQDIDSRRSETTSMNLVNRTAKTINYGNRHGSTKIEFYGTILLPASRGEARVEIRRTYIEVEKVL